MTSVLRRRDAEAQRLFFKKTHGLRLCVFATGFVVLTVGLSAAERPPLLEAAKNDARDVVRSLVAKHVDVNATEADGTTALHWAAYHNDVEAADLLIRAGAKVNAANDLGVTALWN